MMVIVLCNERNVLVLNDISLRVWFCLLVAVFFNQMIHGKIQLI